MTTAINALVISLGDFPLDPDSGKAWLWSGAGERLLWVSDGARSDIGPIPQDNNPADGAPSFLRSFAPLLELPAPDREPVRVQQLTLGNPAANGVYTCLCRHVPLTGGGYGLLAVAIGAPARSLAAMQEQPPQRPETPKPAKQEPGLPELRAEPIPPAISKLPPKVMEPLQPAPLPTAHLPVAQSNPLVQAKPVAMPAPVSPSSVAAPRWLSHGEEERRPLRFVWQTDKDGRFVHLSRELAEAVGLGKSALLGRTWPVLATDLDLLETADVTKGLASGETWNAAPVLWPVEGSTLGVPVEMAGIKVVENGAFAGFRGYGIARIERAIERPATAAEAIAQDASPETEQPEERFGPAAMRALRRTPKPLEISPPEKPAVSLQAPSSPPVAPAAQSLENTQEIDASPLEAGTAAMPPAKEPAITENSSLTSTERRAFREIARALGATEPEVNLPATPGAESPKAETRPRSNASPLDILKQDLLKLAPEAPSSEATIPPEQDRPPAPVISFDILQARREQKFRSDPLTSAGPQIIDKTPVGLLVMQDGKAVFANRHLLDLARFPDLETFLREGGANSLFGSSDGDLTSAGGAFRINTRNGDELPVDATVQAITWDDAPATLTSLRKPFAAPPDLKGKALELDLMSARAELSELRSVLDTATDGVILLDSKGRILSLNRSAEALFGFDQKEIAGESFTILLEPESHMSALDYLEGLKTNGVKSILNDGRDVRGRERKGGTIPLFMTIGRVGEKHGSARFCAVLRDVTHWKKVEGELLEAKRNAETSSDNKTDFLARISHEIRTPLNAIIGFAEVMKTEQFGPIGNERYKQYARDIHASGEHIVSLVNDLLDLSKVAAGKLELSFGSVDVNTVVAASVAMIQPQANAGKVIVRSQLANNLPPVVADERSIRQIMLNLLSNAAKFTEAGGQVVASTSLTDKGEVVIRVRDTGIGMSPEDVRRAMEPFRQISGPRSTGGTGLGLPLTKALVEANRAGFSMESEPSKGTLVEIMFPSTRVLAE